MVLIEHGLNRQHRCGGGAFIDENERLFAVTDDNMGSSGEMSVGHGIFSRGNGRCRE
jgi:hypothetical protein